MKGLLKVPLIVAAIVVVLRIVLEQSGTSDTITNLVSAAALYLIIFPIYFAVRIANSNVAHPYKTLLKSTALYTAVVRLMIVPAYWLAYIYQWSAPRFSAANGGVVGPEVTPLFAYVVIPVLATVSWVIASVIIGGAVGSAIIALKRKSAAVERTGATR